jgi:hypothetical protein
MIISDNRVGAGQDGVATAKAIGRCADRAHVNGQRYANIEDLIHSSAELYFKQGALRYACAAEADVQWEATPSVSLGMKFRWRGATVFFRLQFEATSASIGIHHLALDMPRAAEDLPSRFAPALADAPYSKQKVSSLAACWGAVLSLRCRQSCDNP